MPSYTFWIFIGIGAYLIIGEAILRVRRNTKRGKKLEEIMGVKHARLFNLVIGLLVIGAAFLWYYPS